jgi:hypothetical protein
MTPETPRPASADAEPEVRDGEIPVGIWIVWLAFAVFAVIYVYRYAWPDFLVWIQSPTR